MTGFPTPTEAPLSSAVGIPQPLPASALDSIKEQGGEPIWGPYLRRGHKTLLAAHPKLGKTTLLAHILGAIGKPGVSVVHAVASCKMLVLTEESPALWVDRRDRLGLSDQCWFLFRHQVWDMPWLQLCGVLGLLVGERDFDALLIDTFAYFARLIDENDASEILTASKALDPIATECGAAILLSHHKRKAMGTYGSAVRGSSAFTGTMDIVLELERSRGSRRRRALRCLSRFNDVPEVEIELSADNKSYLVVDLVTPLLRSLPTEPPGSTLDQIAASWPTESGQPPSGSALRLLLTTCVGGGTVTRVGRGSKGEPFRYYRPA